MALSGACATPVDLPRCQAAYAGVARTAGDADAELSRLPPPSCMESVARELHTAFGQLQSGATAMARASSPDQMSAGSGTVHEAIGHMQSAGADAQAITC